MNEIENQRKEERFINPLEAELSFLIDEPSRYLLKSIKRSDIKSGWCAPRPLIKALSHIKTESIVRSYEIKDLGDGVIYMYGGKWTTFRTSAEKTIDLAIKNYGLITKNCCLTQFISVLGSNKYTRDMFYELARTINIDLEYAKHLMNMYGSRSFLLEKYISEFPNKISEKYLFSEGEVRYCIENEDALTADGIVNIRFRVGYFDVIEASKMCIKVEEILKNYFKWNEEETLIQKEYTRNALKALGYDLVVNNTNDLKKD